MAIKVLKSRAARRESSRNAFVAEAMITGELDHPNIVPIYDLGLEDAKTPFYVMKQVHGVEWADRMSENSVRENLDILTDVADAVALAHSRGIIHRDLKPANIMLGEFGEVLVMDWGLAVPAPDSPKPDTFPMARLLMDIALKAMSKAPDDRYQTVGEFSAAVKEYFDHLESITLTDHGQEELKKACIDDDYDTYARTVFAFEQACELWPGNAAAKAGLSKARLSYAESAMAKGEYDLCAAVLQEDDPAHTELRLELFDEIAEEQQLKQQRAQRLKRAQQISYGLIGTVAVTVVISFVWISSERNEALSA